MFFAFMTPQIVLPAYAGMILALIATALALACAPRVCGDDPESRGEQYIVFSCSPRMRG